MKKAMNQSKSVTGICDLEDYFWLIVFSKFFIESNVQKSLTGYF